MVWKYFPRRRPAPAAEPAGPQAAPGVPPATIAVEMAGGNDGINMVIPMTDGTGVPRSLAATGGILLGPDYHFDLTRPGIGLYGGLPFAEARPVVGLSLPVLQTRHLEPGESVGYGATFIAPPALFHVSGPLGSLEIATMQLQMPLPPYAYTVIWLPFTTRLASMYPAR